MHPEHHFVVKRAFDIGWGNLTDDALTFADAVEAILESFRGNHINTTYDIPSLATVLVLEIDGNVAINRTEDVIAACVAVHQADADNGDAVPAGWVDLVRVAA